MQFCNGAPTCHVLVEKGACRTHSQQRERERGTRQSRGYDAAYLRLRTWFMSQPENTLCRHCERRGRYEPATDCHHVQPIRDRPELRLEPSNLEPLCVACHAAADAALRIA